MSSELRLEGEIKESRLRSRVDENARCVRGGGEARARARAKVTEGDGDGERWRVQAMASGGRGADNDRDEQLRRHYRVMESESHSQNLKESVKWAAVASQAQGSPCAHGLSCSL